MSLWSLNCKKKTNKKNIRKKQSLVFSEQLITRDKGRETQSRGGRQAHVEVEIRESHAERRKFAKKFAHTILANPKF